MKWTLMLLTVLGFAAVLAAAQDAVSASAETNELAASDDQDSENTSGAEENASSEDEDDDQVNIRVVRAANNKQKKEKKGGKACRYDKGPWSECDKATNKRTRNLTLKKGDSSCEPTKAKIKPCKNNKDKKRGRN